MKFFVLTVMSFACGIAASKDNTGVQNLLKVSKEIRTDIEAMLNRGKAAMADYPKLYKDAYDDMLQYAKDHWELNFLMSDDTDKKLLEEYALINSLQNHYEDIKKKYDGMVVRFLSTFYL